jgi:hypothetical protein
MRSFRLTFSALETVGDVMGAAEGGDVGDRALVRWDSVTPG